MVDVDVVDQLDALLADLAVVAVVAERALYDPAAVDAPSARRAQHSLMRFRRGLRNRQISRIWSLEMGAATPAPATSAPAHTHVPRRPPSLLTGKLRADRGGEAGLESRSIGPYLQ
jgi:hypothetical protein